MGVRRKTAVVFIHGQGEHVPMRNAVELAKSTLETDDAANISSRQQTADADIRSEEASRVSVRHGEFDDKQTDFYEFYWSHLVEGNRLRDVWRWFRRLIRKPLDDTPEPIRPIRQLFIHIAEIAIIFVAGFCLFTASVFASSEDDLGLVAPDNLTRETWNNKQEPISRLLGLALPDSVEAAASEKDMLSAKYDPKPLGPERIKIEGLVDPDSPLPLGNSSGLNLIFAGPDHGDQTVVTVPAELAQRIWTPDPELVSISPDLRYLVIANRFEGEFEVFELQLSASALVESASLVASGSIRDKKYAYNQREPSGSEFIFKVGFLSDDTFMVFGDEGYATAIQLANGQPEVNPLWARPIADALAEDPAASSLIELSPDGSLLAVSDGESLLVFTLEAGEAFPLGREPSPGILTVAFLPSGAGLFIGGMSGSGEIAYFNGVEDSTFIEGHTDWIRDAIFSPDGSELLTSGDDGHVRIWDAASGANKRNLKLPGWNRSAYVMNIRWGEATGDAVARLPDNDATGDPGAVEDLGQEAVPEAPPSDIKTIFARLDTELGWAEYSLAAQGMEFDALTTRGYFAPDIAGRISPESLPCALPRNDDRTSLMEPEVVGRVSAPYFGVLTLRKETEVSAECLFLQEDTLGSSFQTSDWLKFELPRGYFKTQPESDLPEGNGPRELSGRPFQISSNFRTISWLTPAPQRPASDPEVDAPDTKSPAPSEARLIANHAHALRFLRLAGEEPDCSEHGSENRKSCLAVAEELYRSQIGPEQQQLAIYARAALGNAVVKWTCNLNLPGQSADRFSAATPPPPSEAYILALANSSSPLVRVTSPDLLRVPATDKDPGPCFSRLGFPYQFEESVSSLDSFLKSLPGTRPWEHPVAALTLSPDGQSLAVLRGNGRLSLFDLSNLEDRLGPSGRLQATSSRQLRTRIEPAVSRWARNIGTMLRRDGYRGTEDTPEFGDVSMQYVTDRELFISTTGGGIFQAIGERQNKPVLQNSFWVDAGKLSSIEAVTLSGNGDQISPMTNYILAREGGSSWRATALDASEAQRNPYPDTRRFTHFLMVVMGPFLLIVSIMSVLVTSAFYQPIQEWLDNRFGSEEDALTAAGEQDVSIKRALAFAFVGWIAFAVSFLLSYLLAGVPLSWDVTVAPISLPVGLLENALLLFSTLSSAITFLFFVLALYNTLKIFVVWQATSSYARAAAFLTLAVFLPTALIIYAFATLGSEKYEIFRVEFLFLAATASLICLWLRKLLTGITLSLLTLPFTFYGTAIYAVQRNPLNGVPIPQINDLYAVVLVFSALALIAMSFSTSIKSARLSAALTILLLSMLGVSLFWSIEIPTFGLWSIAIVVGLGLTFWAGSVATQSFLVPIMADSARYLSSKPKDVGLARRVMTQGVSLLDALHDPRAGYDRVIVVAHSLGSIVGLDLLARYWARRYEGWVTATDRQALDRGVPKARELVYEAGCALDEAAANLGAKIPPAGAQPPAFEAQVRRAAAALRHATSSAPFRQLHLPRHLRRRLKPTLRYLADALESQGLGACDRIVDALRLLDDEGSTARPGEDTPLRAARLSFERAANGLHALHDLQAAILDELRTGANTARDPEPSWLITDFVTIGSPLTYAHYLMDEDRYEVSITGFGFDRKRNGNGNGGGFSPNKALSSLPSRWTNLYFSTRRVVFGDIIGGPLWPTFGPSVRDVKLDSKFKDLRKVIHPGEETAWSNGEEIFPNGAPFAHNEYWKWPLEKHRVKPRKGKGSGNETRHPPRHIRALRSALDL